MELSDEPVAIVASPKHPLAKARKVKLADLASCRWIVYPSIMPLRGLFEREFKEAGLSVPPHPIETASTMTTVLMLQRDPTLVSLMPRDMAAMLADHGLATPLAIDVRSRTEPYGAVTRRGSVLSPAARLMIDELT